MKRILLFVIVAFLFAGCFAPCRFSMPLLKIKYKEYPGFDSIWTFQVKRYDYFRISQYGVVGNCAKYKYYDPDSVLAKIIVSKISAMVCDGSAVHHSKTKEFDKEGKLIKKTYYIERERGWAHSIIKEKTIIYGPHRKRTVVRSN